MELELRNQGYRPQDLRPPVFTRAQAGLGVFLVFEVALNNPCYPHSSQKRTAAWFPVQVWHFEFCDDGLMSRVRESTINGRLLLLWVLCLGFREQENQMGNQVEHETETCMQMFWASTFDFQARTNPSGLKLWPPTSSIDPSIL